MDIVTLALAKKYTGQVAEGKQDTLVSGENIKTINGSSVLGPGDIEIKTYEGFKSNWPTTGTTKAFCDVINNDSEVLVGMCFRGGASWSDLPFVGNGDVVVEILQGPSNTKSIHLVLTSGDVAPYLWEYTYWNNGSNTSGWIGFQPELVSGTNIKTVNNTSLLGSGDVTIAGTTFIVTDVIID